jgi:hypothetical protein
MNKSETIRQIIADNPGIMPKQLRAELAKVGLTASKALIGQNLYGRPKPKPELETLLAAKEFVKQAGSIVAARKSLEMLAQLVS